MLGLGPVSSRPISGGPFLLYSTPTGPLIASFRVREIAEPCSITEIKERFAAKEVSERFSVRG